MKKNFVNILQAFPITLTLFSCTGCIEIIGAVGTGAFTTAEYIVAGSVSETYSYEFRRTKKALLVALCRMGILVDRAREIEDGEEITAKAGELLITVTLTQITPTVTRITVNAKKDFLNRDKATAQEIIRKTKDIVKESIT